MIHYWATGPAVGQVFESLGAKEGTSAARVRLGDRLGWDDRCRGLPEGAARLINGRSGGARVPDDVGTATGNTIFKASATSTSL